MSVICLNSDLLDIVVNEYVIADVEEVKEE